jgi:hypothetical protein
MTGRTARYSNSWCRGRALRCAAGQCTGVYNAGGGYEGHRANSMNTTMSPAKCSMLRNILGSYIHVLTRDTQYTSHNVVGTDIELLAVRGPSRGDVKTTYPHQRKVVFTDDSVILST